MTAEMYECVKIWHVYTCVHENVIVYNQSIIKSENIPSIFMKDHFNFPLSIFSIYGYVPGYPCVQHFNVTPPLPGGQDQTAHFTHMSPWMVN